MDRFGIASAVKGVIEVYFRSARASGRTTMLVDSVKKGDTVAFVNRAQAQLFERLCRDRGVDGVKATVIPVGQPEAVFNFPTSEGHMIFDHVWLEEHYRHEIDAIGRRLDNVARQASGLGAAHAETRLMAASAIRWNI